MIHLRDCYRPAPTNRDPDGVFRANHCDIDHDHICEMTGAENATGWPHESSQVTLVYPNDGTVTGVPGAGASGTSLDNKA